MGKRDLTDMLGGGGGQTRQKYKCKADGCQVTPMGVNLSKHYKVNTDWVLLKELKACVGDAALKKKMDQTDPHTRYIFEKGYSKKRLPHQKIKICLQIDLVCRYRILGMKIWNFRYANMDFFKTPHIQI